MKKAVFIAFIAALGVSACKKTDGKPAMTFEETEFNFGKMNQGEVKTHDFTFTNTGDADLQITDAKASCGCTVPEYPKEPVAPGESGTIKVQFSSAGKRGTFNKTIILATNIPGATPTLNISGDIQVPTENNPNFLK